MWWEDILYTVVIILSVISILCSIICSDTLQQFLLRLMG